jgi:hypothetical protein
MNKEEQFKAFVLDQARDCDQSRDELIRCLENLSADMVAPYYHQTDDLYETYEEILWNMLSDYQEDLGEDRSMLELLDNMNVRYTNGQHICNLTGVKQWLVWFGIEHVAHQLAYEMESEKC